VENLDQEILHRIEHGAALEMGAWHTCATTHCRAGWAVVLAGEAGEKLEEALGTNAAGALIYHAAYPDLPVPDFYASNETAFADIEERAARTR